MTEPENFDDELFADLYNDDDAGVKPAAAAAAAAQPDQYAAVQPTTEIKQEETHNNTNGSEQNQDQFEIDYHQQGNYDEEGEEDDDDEIDFNLGNGPTNTIIHHDHHDQVKMDEQHDEKPSYDLQSNSQPQNRGGPNAKEDG